MNGKACMTVAKRLAELLLKAKATGALGLVLKAFKVAGAPSSDELITMSRGELELMMAASVDDGWRRGYARGQGQPIPDDLLSRSGGAAAAGG